MGVIDISVLPTLVIGIGNPRDGDAAIGALMIDKLAAFELRDVELMTDVELSAEHALDILGRRDVVFVDASADIVAPFEFSIVTARPDASANKRALSAAAVLDTCQHLGAALPPAHALVIRGYTFERGGRLSPQAAQNLDAAVAMLCARLGARVLTSPR